MVERGRAGEEGTEDLVDFIDPRGPIGMEVVDSEVTV
jgi:hypothetical protein